jgi:hypothetical protein
MAERRQDYLSIRHTLDAITFQFYDVWDLEGIKGIYDKLDKLICLGAKRKVFKTPVKYESRPEKRALRLGQNDETFISIWKVVIIKYEKNRKGAYWHKNYNGCHYWVKGRLVYQSNEKVRCMMDPYKTH